MKLNRAETMFVNNPLHVFQQKIEFGRLKKMMDLPPCSRVLEVGCGRGAGARIITEIFQLDRVYAMDIDRRMIRKASQYLNGDDRIKLFMGDVADLPFRDGSFDAVFGLGVLHHIVDWRRAAMEIARVLKKGGLYYIEEFYPALYHNFIFRHIFEHPACDRFDSLDLRSALNNTGLIMKDAVEIKKAGILGVAVKK